MRPFLPTVFAAAFAAASSVAAQDWADIETFGGAWDTDWGETWVLPTNFGYEGTYTHDNGRFWLEFTGHVFEGYWAEGESNVRCDVEYMGSYYWGRLQLANSDHYPGITMLWTYCREERFDKVWSFTERLPDGL